MDYELPRTETLASRTPGRFLEGVVAEPISGHKIKMQMDRTQHAQDMLNRMGFVSWVAGLKRQNGYDYDNQPLTPAYVPPKPLVLESVREPEPELVSA